MITHTPLAIGRGNLLNVVRALREAQEDSHFVQDFTMRRFVNTCGTPGCALGHYAHRRDLQSMFVMVQPNGNSAGIEYANETDFVKLASWSIPRAWVRFGDKALQDHFGITLDETEELFEATGCNSAKTLAEAADYIENIFVPRKWPQWS